MEINGQVWTRPIFLNGYFRETAVRTGQIMGLCVAGVDRREGRSGSPVPVSRSALSANFPEDASRPRFDGCVGRKTVLSNGYLRRLRQPFWLLNRFEGSISADQG